MRFDERAGHVIPTDAIRDHVFPLATSVPWGPFAHRGTAFLLGTEGFALTAAHCVPEAYNLGDLVGMFVVGNEWKNVVVTGAERSPSEDVALLRLEYSGWDSILVVEKADARASLGYMSWSYPELAYRYAERRVPAPDLVYSEGHVRRTGGHDIYPLRGTRFLELSDVAGAGGSGSPIVAKSSLGRPKWGVCGIYLGERNAEGARSFGYAAPLRQVEDWRPELSGGRAISEL